MAGDDQAQQERAATAAATRAPVSSVSSVSSVPIVLVGMMGSGKTSIGRRLAARLGLRFFDADEEIEAAAGLSVAEIFERFGEPYFRDGERRVIKRLLETGRSVVATGGGAFAQADTRALILQSGLSVWLDVPLAVLVERVGRRSTRPLLNVADPRRVIAELLEQRRPDYARADIRIDSAASPHARAVDAIVAALQAYEGKEPS